MSGGMDGPRFVTVKICDSRPELNVVCSMLEAHGIECFVNNREMAAQDSQLILALGGLAVQVAAEQERAARQLLAQTEEPVADNAPSDGPPDMRQPVRGFFYVVMTLLSRLFSSPP